MKQIKEQVTMREEVVQDDDPFQFEDFALRERAINTMARMVATAAKKILAEESKAFPDKKKIEELDRYCSKLIDEQRQVYFGDKDLMRRVIDEYIPLLNA